MALTSLPILLYVIPAVMLLTALVPPRRKSAVLGLGGLAYAYFAAGGAGFSLLVLSVSGAWLTLRLMHTEEKVKRRCGVICGVIWQIALLVTARFGFQLPAADMLPLLLCAMLGTECVLERAKGRMFVPPLLAYLSGACAMPHLWAGPLMEFPAMRAMTEQRSVTAEKIGQGAAKCITGLFQMVLLSVPLQTLLTEIGSYADTLSLFDAWLLLLIRYCAVWHWFCGAVRLGEGLALMLGYQHPESVRHTVGAGSLREFCERFCGSVTEWTRRTVLGGQDSFTSGAYFLRMALLLCVTGWLLCGTLGAVVCGFLTAAILTLSRVPSLRRQLDTVPLFLRQVGTALLVLLLGGMPFCTGYTELLRLHMALFGANGTPLSQTVGYLCGTHFLPLFFAVLLLFPIAPLIEKYAAEKKTAARILAVCKPVAELGILLCCMAELLSQYLRG